MVQKQSCQIFIIFLKQTNHQKCGAQNHHGKQKFIAACEKITKLFLCLKQLFKSKTFGCQRKLGSVDSVSKYVSTFQSQPRQTYLKHTKCTMPGGGGGTHFRYILVIKDPKLTLSIINFSSISGFSSGRRTSMSDVLVYAFTTPL